MNVTDTFFGEGDNDEADIGEEALVGLVHVLDIDGVVGRLANSKLLFHANLGLVVFFGIFVDALLCREHDFPHVE